MNKKIYLLMFVLLISIFSVNGIMCYQENAQTSTNCGGLSTGNYYKDTNSDFLYINYTKPNFLSNGNLWQIKHGTLSTYNITLPNSCINQNILQLRVRSNLTLIFGVAYSNSQPQCYNGTWINIGSTESCSASTCAPTGWGSCAGTGCNEGYDDNYNTGGFYYYNNEFPPASWNVLGTGTSKAILYEEGMYWNISVFTLNATNYWNNSLITNYSINVSGNIYNDNNIGNIITNISIYDTNNYIVKFIKNNYINRTYNITPNILTYFTPTITSTTNPINSGYTVGQGFVSNGTYINKIGIKGYCNGNGNITLTLRQGNVSTGTQVGNSCFVTNNNNIQYNYCEVNTSVVNNSFYFIKGDVFCSGSWYFNGGYGLGNVYDGSGYDSWAGTPYFPDDYAINITYYNLLNTLQGQLYQNAINFSAYDYDNSLSIGNFSVYLNNTLACNASNSYNCTGYPNEGYYNISIRPNNNNFYNYSGNITLNTLNTSTITSNVSSLINITFYARTSQSNIDLDYFTVSLNGTLLCSSLNTTNCSGILPIPGGTYLVSSTREPYGYTPTNMTFNHTIYQIVNLTYNNVAIFKFYDEKTLQPFNMSSPTSITINVLCPTETQTYLVSNISTNKSINLSCNFIGFKIDVMYGTTSYFRELYYPTYGNIDFSNVPIYLINLYTATAVGVDFIPDDTLSQYSNIAFIVKKYVNSTPYQVTGGLTDFTGKITTYLMQNAAYSIDLYSDGVFVKSMGQYIANSAGTLPVRLYDITFGSHPTGADSLLYQIVVDNSTYNGTTNLIGLYNDTEGGTTKVEFSVYEESLSGNRINYQVSTSNNVQFVFNATSYDNKYLLCMLNITAYGQNIPYVQKCQDIRFIDLEILQYVNPQVMNWFFMVIVTALALYSTSNTADIINFVIIGISAIFNYFGWIQVSSGFLALAAVLTIGSFISKKYKGEI